MSEASKGRHHLQSHCTSFPDLSNVPASSMMPIISTKTSWQDRAGWQKSPTEEYQPCVPGPAVAGKTDHGGWLSDRADRTGCRMGRQADKSFVNASPSASSPRPRDSEGLRIDTNRTLSYNQQAAVFSVESYASTPSPLENSSLDLQVCGLLATSQHLQQLRKRLLGSARHRKKSTPKECLLVSRPRLQSHLTFTDELAQRVSAKK